MEALKRLKQEPVDLVISDFLMPGMNGLSFFSEVKRMYPEVPRILLTGYADKRNAIKAINEVGLFQYLEKPWDNEQLKLVISNGLASKALKETLEGKIRDLDRVLLQRDELAQKNGMFREELSLARQVQQDMLLQSFPQTDQISFSVRYRPSLEIGGDYYDVLSLASDQLGVLIADVMGHGISAALSTVLLKGAFSSFGGRDLGPAEILTGMNSLLCKGLPRGIFAAAMVVVIDTRKGRCRLANGGIPHPYLLRRRQRQVERVTANGPLLGLFEEEQYWRGEEEMAIELEEEDCLFLYTDGLSETENAAAEQFGSGPMMEAILDGTEKSGEQILEHLVLGSQQFRRQDQKRDDLTILAIEFNR